MLFDRVARPSNGKSCFTVKQPKRDCVCERERETERETERERKRERRDEKKKKKGGFQNEKICPARQPQQKKPS